MFYKNNHGWNPWALRGPPELPGPGSKNLKTYTLV